MDYNQGQRPSSHNIWYSQNNGSNTPPEKPDSFSIVSMICGTVSIVLCCTGIFSLSVGALGILFAILAKRRGRPMSSFSIAGTALSCAGMVFGTIMLIYSFYIVLTDPQYDGLLEDPYNYYYEDLYDYGLEDLNTDR